MRIISFLIIFMISTIQSYGEDITKTLTPFNPSTNITTTLNNTELNFQEKRRSTGPSKGEAKEKVIDFDGNERFAMEQPPKIKPIGEYPQTAAPQPRPLYDLRRKEDTKSSY